MPYKLRKAPKRELYWVVAIDGTHKSRDPLPLERAKAQMRALYAAERRKFGGVRKSIVKNGVYTFNPMLDAREEEDIPAQRHALQLQRVNDALEIERAALARELAADQEAARIRGEESAAQYRRAQQQRAAPAPAPASSRRRQVPIVYPSTRDCLTTTGECIGVMSALAGRGSHRYLRGCVKHHVGGMYTELSEQALPPEYKAQLVSYAQELGYDEARVNTILQTLQDEIRHATPQQVMNVVRDRLHQDYRRDIVPGLLNLGFTRNYIEEEIESQRAMGMEGIPLRDAVIRHLQSAMETSSSIMESGLSTPSYHSEESSMDYDSGEGSGKRRKRIRGGLDKLGKRERDHLISHGMSMGFTREHVIEVMNMFLSEGLFGNELIDAVLEYLADEL